MCHFLMKEKRKQRLAALIVKTVALYLCNEKMEKNMNVGLGNNKNAHKIKAISYVNIQ